MPRRKASARDYSRRGVYVYHDHAHWFAWFIDSRGRESRHYPIFDTSDEEAVKASLWIQLDETDAIPSDDFVPASLASRDRPHLRLLD